ncbi:MAG: LPS assembly protein LptD [Phycisphaeraceae bacterium]
MIALPGVQADDVPAEVTLASEARTQSPLADPVVSADAKCFGRRVSAWTEKGAQFLLLDGDVSITIGSYAFRAERASLRIDTERSQGRRIRHISAYLQNAKSPVGEGAITAEGTRLFVTVSTTGEFDISSDAWKDETAASDPLVIEAAGRLERYLKSLSGLTAGLPDDAGKRLAIEPGNVRPLPIQPPAAQLPVPGTNQAATVDPESRIMAADGILAFNADKLVFQKGEGESTLSLVGNVRLMQIDGDGKVTMTLRAENVVIFMEPMDMAGVAGNRAKSGDVKAIYLESNVIVSDNEYTVRAPRIFYDLRRNKALVLEAVLYAWDPKKQIPLYMRAEKLRQESRKTWTGSKARFTTSEFGEPHVAIAADRMTFQQKTRDNGEPANLFTAVHSTVRVRDVPVFYWPVLGGDAQDTPLRSISATYSTRNGPEIRTTWDLFAILGRENPTGVSLDGYLDYVGKHGPAIGADLSYERPDMFGRINAYLVPLDNGNDELAAGRTVSHDSEMRWVFHGIHRHYLPDNWELTLQLSLISDEAFLEEFFFEDAYRGRPHETSLYLKKQEEDAAFSLLLSYDLNDFTPQLITLQTPGYTVEKLPEFGWFQVGTPLWENRLTYFGETRLSYMRIHAGSDKPVDRGFNEPVSQQVFGHGAFVPFDDGVGARGVPTEFVLRFDTRHEIQAPMKFSIFNITPYVSARVTAYDETFEAFGGEDDPYRVFATAGVRLHTHFTNVYDDIDIRLLDVHRLRHVIEPSVDLSYGASTSDPRSFPIFDPDVEGISDGYGIRLGLRNTLQTQRGVEGAWRSVDWVTLDTDLVLRGDNSDAGLPLARYFSYRPEYSRGGDHIYTRLLVALTDSLALAGEVTYDLERTELALWRVGASYIQNPNLSWFVNYTEIDDLPAKLLSWGFNYDLTAKYRIGFVQTIDMEGSQSRNISLLVTRKLPRWRLIARISHDEILNEQQFSIIIVPDGIRAFNSGLFGN